MTSRGQRLLGLLRRLRLLAVVVLCCLCVSDTGARWLGYRLPRLGRKLFAAAVPVDHAERGQDG